MVEALSCTQGVYNANSATILCLAIHKVLHWYQNVLAQPERASMSCISWKSGTWVLPGGPPTWHAPLFWDSNNFVMPVEQSGGEQVVECGRLSTLMG